jgi:creatinine amidohydrolase
LVEAGSPLQEMIIFGDAGIGGFQLMAQWEDLTMPGFEALQQKTRTVILPLGSLEEHGPHLPLGTDTFHALEVARRVAALRPVVVAPPLFYGICRSTREHPGTVSISGDALRAMLLSVGREFYRQGWHNLVFISGHAGGTHMSAIIEAGEGLLAELPEVRVAVVNLLEVLREVVADKPELVHTPGDSHAGEVETAIMMAAYPELVRGTAPEEWPRFPKYVLVRDKRRYWPGGVWGNPALATAAQGKAILAAEADRLSKLINELEDMEDR